MRKTFIYGISCLLIAATAIAAPIEFDTEDAHIIIVRPIDLWSGDLSSTKDIMKSYEGKKVTYVVENQDQSFLRGYPTVFQSIPDHPITNGVEKKLNELGFKSASDRKHNFKIEKSISIDSAEFQALAQYQQALFKHMVISQGNPETLASRVKGGKFLSGLLSIGALLVSLDNLGAVTGANFSFSSGIPESLYRSVSRYRGSVAPINLLNTDLKNYQTIDVRRVTTSQPDRMGQVIIAYKNAKTIEAEQTALIQAIITLSGADTTSVNIKKSHEENYAERVAIWTACAADETCKPSAIDESGIKSRLRGKHDVQQKAKLN